MLRNIQILFFLLLSLSVQAQSEIRINQYWENMIYLTPASINVHSPSTVSIGGKKQWLNFNGAPVTYMAAATFYVENVGTQFGLKLKSDQIGYVSTNDVALSFAYQVNLNEQLKCNFGIAGVFQNSKVDYTLAVTAEADDQTVPSTVANRNKINSDFGLEFTDNRQWQLGAFSQNLFSRSASDTDLRINYVYGKYRYITENALDFGMGACGIQAGNQKQFDLYFVGYLKEFLESNRFKDILHAGLTYRYPFRFGAQVGINVTDNWMISYNYEYNTSNLRKYSIGSHEIVITYCFKRKPFCFFCDE
jgi:type IX secretion system PorP/SprF family membrane protein